MLLFFFPFSLSTFFFFCFFCFLCGFFEVHASQRPLCSPGASLGLPGLVPLGSWALVFLCFCLLPDVFCFFAFSPLLFLLFTLCFLLLQLACFGFFAFFAFYQMFFCFCSWPALVVLLLFYLLLIFFVVSSFFYYSCTL